MRVFTVSNGETPAYALAGSVLTVGKVVIDLATRQEDMQKTIDLCYQPDGSIAEGLGTTYAINVVLPPRRFKEVQRQEKGLDGKMATIVAKEAEPLNMDDVVMQLWGKPGKQ